ncbi:MAG: preprotein translocase subunit SecG [Bacteroidales bacterium]
MYTFLAILIVIASILLTLIVLVQNSKGGGLAANFASGNQAFGVRQTADFLERVTWILAIVIISLSVLATAFVSTGVKKQSVIQERIESSAPAQSVPEFPTIPGGEATKNEESPTSN